MMAAYIANQRKLRLKYSEVPNKRVTFFIIFGEFFLPTWPYQELHVY